MLHHVYSTYDTVVI